MTVSSVTSRDATENRNSLIDCLLLTVARVYSDGVDANAEQVRRCMAWVCGCYGSKNSPLYGVQAEARAARRGLWADRRDCGGVGGAMRNWSGGNPIAINASEEIAIFRTIIVAAMVAASFGSIATPATAAIVVQVALLSPRAEATPSPRRGYVWVAGHWDGETAAINGQEHLDTRTPRLSVPPADLDGA